VSATWPDVAIQVPRPRRRRWLRRIVVILLLALIGLGVRSYYSHRKTVTGLEAALAELDREEPGWRLKDIEAARAVVPDSENGALCVAETSKLLPPKWPSEELDRQFSDVPPPEQLGPADYADLCKELDALRPAMEEAHKLAMRPNGRYKVTYLRNTFNTLLKDQAELRRVAKLLTYDALRQAQAGDLKAALASCRATLNAGRSVGDEPFMVSLILRTACVSAACQTAERVLAQGEPAPDDLLALQRLLRHEAAHPALWIATRGERALMQEMFDALECGDVRMSQLAEHDHTPPSWQERYFGWHLQDHFRSEHPVYLSMMTRRVAEVQLPPHEQGPTEQAFAAEAPALPKEAVLTRLFLPAVEKVGSVERRRLANVHCLGVAVAAECYRREHGAWPESLEKLVPSQLAEVPLDPYDGEPLRYRRLADGVVVYCVGDDGADDDGTLDRVSGTLHRANPTQSGTDLGTRLWDVKHRRQLPRPKEKPPEEPDAPGGPPP
jgi:hypothetical protein